MRTPTAPFALRRARTLDAALKILREEPGTVPIAGCTDVYVALEFGGTPGTSYLDLTRLSALKRITTSGDKLVIGALATYTEVQKSRFVRARLPMLVEAARLVGGAQIQNMGTVGGNLANASPAGDTLPVFAVADADVVLAGPDGERRVPFNAFYTGYRKSVRRPDELIVAVEVPPVTGKQWFRKVGTRAAQAISKVVMAAVGHRVALGSVAPTILRLRTLEEYVKGGGRDAGEAKRLVRAQISPIDDVRSTKHYRVRVAESLVEEWINGLPAPRSR
jgi:CO/xanthine dehydrogenase FAD-binding subunit